MINKANDTRFNGDAWVEVWVTPSDFEAPAYRDIAKAIREMPISDSEKIAKLQVLAKEIASNKLMLVSASLEREDGVSVSCDNLELDKMMNRINWGEILNPKKEEESGCD